MKKYILAVALSVLLPLFVHAQNMTDIRADIRQTMKEFCSALSNINDDMLDRQQSIKKFKLYEPQIEPRAFTFAGERNLTLPQWVENYALKSLLYVHVTHTLDITDLSLRKVSDNPDDRRYTFDGIMKREFLSVDEEFVTDEFPVKFTVIWTRKGKLVEITEINGAWPALDPKYRDEISYAFEKLANGQNKEAMEIYRELAEGGNVQAQYLYGYLNYMGLEGMPVNHKEAGKWIEKAAKKDFPMAQYYMAHFYIGGNCGFKEDYHKAIEWLEKAIQQDVVEAKYLMYAVCLDGLGGLPKDTIKAIDYLIEAADQGYVGAQHELGLIYAEGQYGLEKDEEKAVEWLTRSAYQGYVESQYILGRYYSETIQVKFVGYNSYRQRDLLQAAEWFKKAIEQGHTDSMYELALIYKESFHLFGLTQDAAIELWQTASDLGHLPSMHELAISYQSMYHDNESAGLIQKAFDLWTIAANHNYADAQYSLGMGYYLGYKHQPKDIKLAVTWVERAAKNGHSTAQYKLGLWYANGENGLPKSYKDAVYWLTESHNNGDRLAAIPLGDLYYFGTNKNAYKAVKYWQPLSEYYPECQYRMGLCHFYGEGGLEKDEKKGLEMINKAANQHIKEAQQWLEKYNVLQADLQKAKIKKEVQKEYEQKNIAKEATAPKQTPPPTPKPVRKVSAADQKRGEELYLLGNHYYFGTSYYPKSPQKAVKYWQEAAQLGNVKAQCELGTLYYNGECGLNKSAQLAVHWWQQAAEQGFAKAQFNLGAHYFRSLKKNKANKELSKQWLKQAAQQGHAKAIELLTHKNLK